MATGALYNTRKIGQTLHNKRGHDIAIIAPFARCSALTGSQLYVCRILGKRLIGAQGALDCSRNLN
jgi:hypothetical protein